MNPEIRTLIGAGLALAAAACASAPFGYAEDRCVGARNRCDTSCASLRDGPAHAACIQRCQMQESQCRVTGDDSATALSVDRSIGEARSEREKEEGFRRWKAAKEKEREAQEALKAQQNDAP
ncbi:MAG: hypothetical protein GC153_04285 [Alphaproteobacteria bacterium]|nr:hypothetical protein [Alphaproteobacteria bacterium]